MTVVSAYAKGFVRATRSPRMLFLLYAINFLLAVILALPLSRLFNQIAGNSMEWQVFMKDFDYNFFKAIFEDAGSAWTLLKAQIVWVAIIYLVINIFITGGILRTVNTNHFTVSTFFGGSGQSFFRFLGLDTLMLILHSLTVAAVIGGFSAIYDSALPKVESEQGLYWIVASGVFVYLILFLFLLMVSDFSKSYMELKGSFNFFKGFGKGMAYTFRHLFKSYTLYLLLMLVPVALTVVYFLVDDMVKTRTGTGILIMFFVQQAFIFSRVWTKIWCQSSQFKIFADDIVKDEALAVERTKIREQKKMAMQTAKEAEKVAKAEIEAAEDEAKSRAREAERKAQLAAQEAENNIQALEAEAQRKADEAAKEIKSQNAQTSQN
jgi:hypothetical protein